MGPKAALMVLFAVTGMPAHAHDGESCAPIKSDARRLECYDLAFRKSSETKAAAPSDWVVTEEKSKIDDTSNVFLRLRSIEPIDGRFGRRDHVTLMITCREKKTDLFINFADHFMSSLGSNGNVTVRIDKKPAKTVRMQESNDHKALGLWRSGDAIPLIRELATGQALLIRATPHTENSITAEFRIGGLEEAISPLVKACGWSMKR